MTPKEAAIAVEKLLMDAGYTLGDLTFYEAVGGRVATYDFSAPCVTSFETSGNVRIHDAPVEKRGT